MMVGSTSAVYTEMPLFADIRCRTCRRLLFRWEFQGLARIEVKCPRCGTVDTVALSTS